jgi:Deoxyribonuclease NucA/NucB
MVFFNPAATNQYASLTVGPTEEIRCDSLTVFKPTKGGCVYLHYTENFFTVSTADKTVTAAAKFMAAAQKKIHNHAGWYGHGGALTRLSNAKTIAKNRRVACKNVHLASGQSCDEYPFASTNQGASQVPTNDWDSAALSAAQNSKVGSYLSSFLLRQRIASGDSYYVDIVS